MFFQKLSEFSEKYTVFLKNLSEFSGAKYGKNREKFCFCGREVGKCKRPQRTALTAQKGSPCGLPFLLRKTAVWKVSVDNRNFRIYNNWG